MSSTAAFAEENVVAIHERMRAAFACDANPPAEARQARLRRLLALIEENEAMLSDAISADFGVRSRREIELSETFTTIAEIKQAIRRVPRWMNPERVHTPLHMIPGRARIERQPVGVVGIISPWNYPLFLSLAPVAAALAAGNRVLLKPSELTPHFSELLRAKVAEYFEPDVFAVATGGREVGEAIARLPLDHLLFTGSTVVGREIAKAAAANLTPVTLELGGKSPAIVGASAKVDKAARSIAFGKLLNCGQTCIAPDYLLAANAQRDAVVRSLREQVAKMFGDAKHCADYTSVISDRHYARLSKLVEDARSAGATVISLGDSDASQRRMPLQIVVDPPRDGALMREEIFGPVLPVISYDTIADAIAEINAAPRPLALYYFGEDVRERERVLRETISGGVTVNGTLWHIIHPNLPFGGVGASGIGAYHGEHGFRRFSHEKAVFVQSKLDITGVFTPPYGRMIERVLTMLRRMV